MRRGFTPIIILIIIALLAGGGYFVYKNFNLVPKVATSTSSSVPVATSNSTSNWKTYINTKYNYSISYPGGWRVTRDEESNQPAFISLVQLTADSPKTLDNFVIMIEDKTYSNLLQELDGAVTQYNGKTADFQIGKNLISAKRFEYITGANGSDYVVNIVFQNNSVFEIVASFANPPDSADLANFNQILSTFKFTDVDTATPPPVAKSNIPVGWKANNFSSQNLTIYTPTDWQSSIQDFPAEPSTLIKFWKKISPDIVPIQLNIKPNWNNIGIDLNQQKSYLVGGTIPGFRVDPPKKEEANLERYETEVFFEHSGKVYVFECVHNWVADYVNTCNKMLESMSFTN